MQLWGPLLWSAIPEVAHLPQLRPHDNRLAPVASGGCHRGPGPGGRRDRSQRELGEAVLHRQHDLGGDRWLRPQLHAEGCPGQPLGTPPPAFHGRGCRWELAAAVGRPVSSLA